MRRLTIMTITLAVMALATLPTTAQERRGGGIVDWLAGGRVKGDQDEVTVGKMASVADALPLAIAHCSHYGRSAQYARKSGDDFVFRCLPKS